jgi:hypothetical protein
MENMIKMPIANFNLPKGLRFDYFICSSSFEDRCLTLAMTISKELIDNAIIYHFENNYEISDERLKLLKVLFQDKGLDIITLKKHQPITNFDVFWKTFVSFKNKSIIAIDITTFTRENLLMLLRIAFLKKDDLEFHLFYTPSDHYSSSDASKEIWLTKGVKEIRSVFSFPGDFSPLKNFLLIILTGFEYERAQTLIDIYEPAKLVLGKAGEISSINSELAAVNDNNFKHLQMMNRDSESFDFSCINLEDTIKVVKEQIQKYKNDYNIIISPMNNKLSSLAVGLVAIEDPSVQICYASTNQYNINAYSSASDFILKIDLNPLLNDYSNSL